MGYKQEVEKPIEMLSCFQDKNGHMRSPYDVYADESQASESNNMFVRKEFPLKCEQGNIFEFKQKLQPGDIDLETMKLYSKCYVCDRFINQTKTGFFECNLKENRRGQRCADRNQQDDKLGHLLCRQCGTCEFGHPLSVSYDEFQNVNCASKHYRFFKGKLRHDDPEIGSYAYCNKGQLA